MNSSSTKLIPQVKISIGLPVYNEEKFIQKCIESWLAQTFTDFELIISDNASTDNTSKICEEYAKRNKKIRYIRQEKKIEWILNFNFVLKEAKNDYFVWAGADDFVLPDFLKKNIEVLVSNNDMVGSISKISRYGLEDRFYSDSINYKFGNFVKNLRLRFRKREVCSISGTYEKKVRTYLKKSTCQILYGVFRTDKLRKSILSNSFVGVDWAEALNVLRYGNFHVIDEVLRYEFEGGRSARGIIHISRNYNPNYLSVIFPWHPFIFWCVKNLGVKIFLKNLDFFIKLNFEGVVSQVIDIIRLFTNKLFGK